MAVEPEARDPELRGPIQDGRGPELIVCGDDLTARRQAEVARRKAQDEVLSIVSHDLRGPLNAIVLACDALRSGSAAEQDECLRTIERSAARSVRLLQDLLQVVRIESGALPMQRGPVDLGELVRTLCTDHRAAATTAGCNLTYTLGSGSLVVHGDLDRLYQVGANLLVNAFVHARGAAVEVTAIDAGAAVVLSVTDQGPGIPLADQPKVFDRFRQTGSNRTGAGLGLTIVSRLVGAHGGTIRLVSQPGLGARFEITLPRAPAAR